MVRVLGLTLALVLSAALAGCMAEKDDEEHEGTTLGHEYETRFEGLTQGVAPNGWTATGGAWLAATNATSTHGPGILQGTGSASVGSGRVTLVANEAGKPLDFTMYVAFNIVSGEHPQGGGLSFNFVDDQHYALIRYSSSEEDWNLFIADGGAPSKIKEATVAGHGTHHGLGEWIELKVVEKDGHVTAFDGATKVIDYALPAATAVVGNVGLMIRGESVVQFDDFELEPEA